MTEGGGGGKGRRDMTDGGGGEGVSGILTYPIFFPVKSLIRYIRNFLNLTKLHE